MKKLGFTVFISILLVTIIGSCGNSNEKANVTEDEAEIKFDTISHDFGLVPKDSSARYDFVFYNIGATPLHLTDVSPSCGCTVAKYPHGGVEPGSKAVISVIFDSHNRQLGHFKKSIRVRSDAKTSFIRLSISGEVTKKKE